MALHRLIPERIVRTQVEMNEPYVVGLPQVRQLVPMVAYWLQGSVLEEAFGNQERFTTTDAAVPRGLP